MTTQAQAQTPRDPWYWPFAANSIWNTPIGSSAQYVACNFGTLGYLNRDDEFDYRSSLNDPYRPVYRPDSTTISYLSIYIPDSYTTSSWGNTPNLAAAWLRPDGFSLDHIQPLLRPSAGSIVQGWVSGNQGTSLFGDGLHGSHSGSDMSSFGGSIRRGELTDPNAGAIHHAIHLELDWQQLYRSTSNSANDYQTYRWPAFNSDSGGDSGYSGTNSALQMGALLAVPGSLTETSLGLQTVAGKRLFHALQDYGGYVVDTSGNGWIQGNGGYSCNIGVESGVDSDFQSTYGYGFNEGPGNAWYSDVNAIYKNLYVINTNTATTIGGGGTPRVSTAIPAFAYGGSSVGVYTALPAQIEAENYDVGGEGVGYHDTDNPNDGGAYRNDGVDIEACSEGGYDVGWTASGEWLNYSVSVPASGTYTLTVRYAATSNGTIHINDENGNNLTGSISLPSTGGWQTWQSVTVNLTLASGNHTLQLAEDSGGFNLNYLNFAAAQTVYNFSDVTANSQAINGTHGGINFGTGKWAADLSYAGLGKCGYFSTSGPTSASFTLPTGKYLRSIQVSGTQGGTYSISDGVNSTKTGNITNNTPTTVTTGWTNVGTTVTVTFSKGWNSVLTNITY